MGCWKWTNREYVTGVRYAYALKWGVGVEHAVQWRGRLCEEGVIHAYHDPRIAVITDPAHGRYSTDDGFLWECKAYGRTVSAPDKIGVERLMTVAVVDPPVISPAQRVEIAIRTVMVFIRDRTDARNEGWRAWANRWLSGEDRSLDSAILAMVLADRAQPYRAACAAAYLAEDPYYTLDKAAIEAAANAIVLASDEDESIDLLSLVNDVCGETKP